MLTEQNASKAITALEYLRDQEMDQELLRDLHHNERRDETYAAAIRYRLTPPATGFEQHNVTYHRRLLFVAAEHWRTERPFAQLVAEALAQFPKLP